MTDRKSDAIVPSADAGRGALTKRPAGDLVARGLADLQGLQAANIRFFAAYEDEIALACGALKDLGDGQIEVKSVHVASRARGRGIARTLMLTLHEIAAQSGARALLLETGSDQLPPFDAARALYENLG